MSTTARAVEEKIKTTTSIMEMATHMSDKTVEDYIKTEESIDVIVEKIENINAISEENVKGLAQINTASHELRSMSSELNATLSTFRT